MELTKIFVHIDYREGYVLGADLTDSVEYHPEGYEDAESCETQTWDVPTADVEKYTSHGLSEQFFSDGYIAFRDLNDYGTLVFSPNRAFLAKWA